jgi:hypothetical protein
MPEIPEERLDYIVVAIYTDPLPGQHEASPKALLL